MTTYSKITDYASKDALLTGNPSKIIKGVEIGAEFDSIAAADATSVKTGGAASVSSVTDSGNLTFTGTGNRITGDFSNATIANRVMFQTSTVNGGSTLTTIPNGTATQSGLVCTNNQDPTNGSECQSIALTTEITFRSAQRGTGTYLPMTFYTGGVERMRIDTSGNVLVTGSGGLGYGTGSGGTVTQITNKNTGVTINKPNGEIVMEGTASIAANTTIIFTVTNSTVAATDTVIVHRKANGSGGSYIVGCDSVSAGSFIVYVRNSTAGALAEIIKLTFAVIKAVNA